MVPSLFYCDYCGAANQAQDTTCFACGKALQSFLSPALPPVLATVPGSAPQAKVASPQAVVQAIGSSNTGLAPNYLLKQRYRIISQVGKGGFGVVYKAKDSQHKHKLVAVKQIDLRTLNVEEIIEVTDMYNREVTLLSGLKHANLPHIYDQFTDPEHWYLVMDFIEGKTLEDYLQKARRGFLRVKEVLSIGITLCSVLSYLHTQRPPIIFRDLKPANIMRTPRGRLYLIDFGIARRFTPGQARDTGPLGSPGYAAPEQYGKAQTTAQSDIYGLGATLQTLLTGEEPLPLVATLPLPRRGKRKKLQQLLNQMLERDASKRPKDMGEVKWSLQRMKDGVLGPIAKQILLQILLFVAGLFFASMPYSLLTFLRYFHINVLYNFEVVFFLLLLCSWPFLCFWQLAMGIHFLRSPRRRFLGLGILAMIVFLILGLLFSFIPAPFAFTMPSSIH